MSYLYSFEDRFNKLLEMDNTQEKDLERKSLFHIIAGSSDLYQKVNHIYDFENSSIKADCLDSEEVDFSSSSKALIRLAFNLYNGFITPLSDVLSVFSGLDDNNFELCINALKLRFDRINSTVV